MTNEDRNGEAHAPARGSKVPRAVLIVGIGLVFVLLGGLGLMSASHAATMHDLQQKNDRITREIHAKSAAEDKKSTIGFADASGVDQNRVNRDYPKVQGLMQRVFTWNNAAQYEDMRKNLVTQYKLPQNGPFLTKFVPPATYNIDQSGKKYYAIDATGQNSQYSDLTLFPQKVDKDSYTYLAFVESSVQSVTKSAAVSRVSIVTLTMDGKGKITDISGIGSSDPERKNVG